jgi:RNA polymerase sigma factor, sigma-70 family/RNA polymerase sigma-70 factor, Bacteroides expansion family 1
MHRTVEGSLAVSRDVTQLDEATLRRDRRHRGTEGSALLASSAIGLLALTPRFDHHVPTIDMNERSAELLARFRRGEEGAFEAVFRAYAAPLCDFALHFTRSRDIATEVVHDVFLLVWERRERLDVRTNLRAYLYRATRNRALEVNRRDTFFRRWADRTAHEQAYDDSARLAPTPHEQLECDERVAALQQAIDALPERRRMVLLLRWRDGLHNDEVAELMGISVKTVENQITQALRVLRERLFEHDG